MLCDSILVTNSIHVYNYLGHDIYHKCVLHCNGISKDSKVNCAISTLFTVFIMRVLW